MASSDLDWLLSPGAKPPAKSKAQREKALKEKKREEWLKAQAREEALLHKIVDEMQVWTPEAQVVILFETKCSCLETSLVPEVTPLGFRPTTLVRFRHKKTGALWEKRCEAQNIPPGLPRVVRQIPAVTSICEHCCPTISLSLVQPPQLNLFEEN